MKLNHVIVVLLMLGAAGCSSPQTSSPLPAADNPGASNTTPQQSLPFTQSEFIDAVSTFILKAGQDIKASGYAVIFVDIGPESMEESLPGSFQEFVRKSSGGGVQVRGYSRMREGRGAFRDKQTGERGVRFAVVGFAKQADNKFLIMGQWDESPTKNHAVKHTVIREGTIWKAL